MAELYAKQYDFWQELGHVLACKISCNQRKKNSSFNHEAISSKRSVKFFDKIDSLVFEKSCLPTSKVQFWEKSVWNKRRPISGSEWEGI